jgi:hypothetical protein
MMPHLKHEHVGEGLLCSLRLCLSLDLGLKPLLPDLSPFMLLILLVISLSIVYSPTQLGASNLTIEGATPGHPSRVVSRPPQYQLRLPAQSLASHNHLAGIIRSTGSRLQHERIVCFNAQGSGFDVGCSAHQAERAPLLSV